MSTLAARSSPHGHPSAGVPYEGRRPLTPASHIPDSKVHGANMGPTWGRQDPGGPHVGRVNLANNWDGIKIVF